jgi:hypothetical protein
MRAATLGATLAATLGATFADTLARTAGRAAGLTAGAKLGDWGVARMALLTADRWLIKDFFCTDMMSSVKSWILMSQPRVSWSTLSGLFLL